MNKRHPRETEAALVIRSARAAEIAREIARLDGVGDFRLERQATQEIRDIYFDTPDRALEKQRLGLRIRQVNGKMLITLKGPSRKNGAIRARLEIEAAWSQNALKRVLAELDERDIEIELPRGAYQRANPIRTLTRLGLQVIQDRRTIRQVRSVLPKNRWGGEPLAEMAIDTVTFRAGRQVVRLHEIEIEAKEQRAGGLARLVQGLVEMYKPALQVWESKLATGRAIDALAKDGALKKLIGANKNLTPRALDAIGRRIKS